MPISGITRLKLHLTISRLNSLLDCLSFPMDIWMQVSPETSVTKSGIIRRDYFHPVTCWNIWFKSIGSQGPAMWASQRPAWQQASIQAGLSFYSSTHGSPWEKSGLWIGQKMGREPREVNLAIVFCCPNYWKVRISGSSLSYWPQNMRLDFSHGNHLAWSCFCIQTSTDLLHSHGLESQQYKHAWMRRLNKQFSEG